MTTNYGPSNPTEMLTPELLDVEGIAEYLAITVRAVRSLVAGRQLPVIKIGQRVRVRRADLDAYLEANTREVVR